MFACLVGWLVIGPGSFLEVRKLLPLLTQASPEHPSFHVVAISLPGYGFSEAPRKPGFAGAQYAEVTALLPSLRCAKCVFNGMGMDRSRTD